MTRYCWFHLAWLRWCFALFIIALLSDARVASADDKSQIFVCSTTGPITIDGRLSEPAWAAAATVYPTHIHGGIPLEPVELKLLWSPAGMHVGAVCLDTDLRGRTKVADTMLWQDGDVVELFFIPGQGKLSRIELQFGIAGGHTDIGWQPGKGYGPQTVGWNWEGMKHAVTFDGTLNDDLRDRSWTLEVFLPWEALEKAGIARPTQGSAWRFMAMIVNRAQLTSQRAGRTLTCWPMLTRAISTAADEYGRLIFASPPAGNAFEGFSEIIDGSSGHMGALRPDYRGMSPMWVADDQARLRWHSQPLPDKLPPRVRLFFTIETVGQPADEKPYELWLNGKLAIAFRNPPPQDFTLKHENVTLRYHHREGGNRLRNGVLELNVPAAMLTPGKPALLEFKRSAAEGAGEFRLFGRVDTAAYEQLAGRVRSSETP